jgi:hypothetical protein
MADRVIYDTENTNRNDRNGGRKILYLLLGLLLGSLLGWTVANAMDTKEDNNSGNTNSSQQSGSEQNNSSQGLISLEQTPSPRTLLAQYSQLLVEASREGVDIPSAEADAAKSALETSSNELAESLKLNDAIKQDMVAINDSLLKYAGTVKTAGDTHPEVDRAFTKLSADLKQQYNVDNTDEFDAKVTSWKNTLLEGIRDFSKQDYAASYTKQLQAEEEVTELFAQLKNKQ